MELSKIVNITDLLAFNTGTDTLDLNVPKVVAAGSYIGLDNVASVTSATSAVLTAAEINGRNILRSGPTAAYGDTTDTAADIIAGIPNAQVGTGFEFTIANEVAFANTIVAGVGVTLAGTTAISASTSRKYLLKVTEITPTPAVTITGISSGGL